MCYDVIFVVGFIEILKFFMFFGIGKFEYLVVLNVIFLNKNDISIFFINS